MNVAKFEKEIKENPKQKSEDKQLAVNTEEEIIIPPIDQKEAGIIIDKYIMGEPIEKKFNIRGKIPFILRDPDLELLKISEHSLYVDNKDLMTMELPRVINEGLLACYVIEFNGHNFIEKQGDKFNTKESYIERKTYFLEKMNIHVKEFVLNKIKEFQQLLKIVFSEEHLKNS